MKKRFPLINLLLTILLLAMPVLTACQPTEVVLHPDDPVAQAVSAETGNQVVTVPLTEVMVTEEIVTSACGEVKGLLIGEEETLVICKDPEMFSNTEVAFIAVGSVIALAEPTPFGEAIVGFTVGANGVRYALIAVGLVAAATTMTASTPLGAVVTVTNDSGVYIPTNGDHHVEHNIVAGSAAYAMATVIVQALNGGPRPDPDQMKCFLMKVGDSVARVITWVYTNSSATGIPRGDLVWWHTNSPYTGGPEWGGAYANKSGATLENIPRDLENVEGIKIESTDCNNLPPAPPLSPAG